MKTMNRASAVLLILALLSLESPGAWWVPVLCAAAAALAALFVSSSRLGYLGTGAGARRSTGLPPRASARPDRRTPDFANGPPRSGDRAA